MNSNFKLQNRWNYHSQAVFQADDRQRTQYDKKTTTNLNHKSKILIIIMDHRNWHCFLRYCSCSNYVCECSYNSPPPPFVNEKFSTWHSSGLGNQCGRGVPIYLKYETIHLYKGHKIMNALKFSIRNYLHRVDTCAAHACWNRGLQKSWPIYLCKSWEVDIDDVESWDCNPDCVWLGLTSISSDSNNECANLQP